MTLEQAKLENLDVYHFTVEAARAEFACNVRSAGRAVSEFEETVAGFKLFCLAVGNRSEYGQIAKHVKQVKTIRQFIGDE